MSLLLNKGAVRESSAPAERAGAIPTGAVRNGGSARNAPGTDQMGDSNGMQLVPGYRFASARG